MRLLTFYVAKDSIEPVKQAIFEAGAGAYGQFSSCCWQILGEGQYQEAAQSVTKLAEYKVELLVQEDKIAAVVAALKASHPCPQPLYYITAVDAFI